MEEAKNVHKFTITIDHAKMKPSPSIEVIFTPNSKRSYTNKCDPGSHSEHAQF
jgi:hypothetical protein